MILKQWTSSLTASSRKFRKVWDGTGRNSQNQIYTCMVKMILKSWYIAWEGRQRGGFEKTPKKKDQRTSYWKKNSWLLIKLLRPSYSGYAEDNLCILCSQYFFQITHDRYLFSKIRPVLSPTLYKFIVWTCWVKIQFYTGSNPNSVLTVKI